MKEGYYWMRNGADGDWQVASVQAKAGASQTVSVIGSEEGEPLDDLLKGGFEFYPVYPPEQHLRSVPVVGQIDATGRAAVIIPAKIENGKNKREGEGFQTLKADKLLDKIGL